MSYTKTVWVNGVAPPIDATNLNKIEQGLADAHDLQGVPGPQGVPGNDGADGSQGIQGPDGPTGADGPIGDDGPIGPIGDDGPIGPAGEKGDTGLTGSQGLPGPEGPEGPAGLDGLMAAATLAEVDAGTIDTAAVTPATFDQAAKWDEKVDTDVTGIAGASVVNNLVTMTRANYDALGVWDASTAYFIVG